MFRYDEPMLVQRLGVLDRRAKTAFASACAQWALPLFSCYAKSIHEPEMGRRLEEVVASAWGAAAGIASDIGSLQDVAESMVPTDEGVWTREMGFGQNAASAAAYAVRTWLTDDAQEAAWAARQVYEAADYSVMSLKPASVFTGAESSVISSSAVQTALSVIIQALDLVEAGAASFRELREYSESEGQDWAAAYCT